MDIKFVKNKDRMRKLWLFEKYIAIYEKSNG